MIGRVAEADLERLYVIKNQLKTKGVATVCPAGVGKDWLDCSTCARLFPKINYPQNYEIKRLRGLRTKCPCSAYSVKYLISRVNELIVYSEACVEERRKREQDDKK